MLRVVNLSSKPCGTVRKHWFRAKFLQQYRLFFRYSERAKIIVIARVNDEATKRAYGSSSDAYAVFRTMLGKDRPPDDWGRLVAECETAANRARRLASRRVDDPSDPDGGEPKGR